MVHCVPWFPLSKALQNSGIPFICQHIACEFSPSTTVHFIDPRLAVAQFCPWIYNRGISLLPGHSTLTCVFFYSLLFSNTPRNELLTMATSTIYSSVPRPLYDIYPNDLLNQDHQISVSDGSNIDSGESFYPMSDNGVQAPAFAYPLSFQKPDNLSYFQPQVGLPPTFSANGVTYSGEMASTFANNVVTYDWGMVPTFPTNGVMYNGGLPPTFQSYTGLPPSQTPAPSLITASSSASTSSSLQHTFAPLPAPLVCKGAQKVNTKSKEKGKRATRNATQSVKRKLLTGQPKRKRGPNKRPGGTSFSELLVRSIRLG